MLERVLSVSQLNDYVSTLFQFDPLLSRVSVEGEISNLTRHSSGHWYFSLKDEGAVIRCAMFRQYSSQVEWIPENGSKVVAKGNVSLYKRDGQYQLTVQSLKKQGLGEYYERLEALKQKLQAEGLFEEEHKKPLPWLPRRLGVITSPTGAVIRDIVNVSQRRFPGMEILLYPVTVQGKLSAAQSIDGLRYFNREQNVDVIILGRGGGSTEDLWAYNDEQLARTIFESEIPVISAVGHETDFTIADFVADMRAPTPSAAAELATPERDGIRLEIAEALEEMEERLCELVENKREQVKQLEALLGRSAPGPKVLQYQQRLDRATSQLASTAVWHLKSQKNRLDALTERLELKSPMAILRRGYAAVRREGHVVRSVRELDARMEIELQLQDGSARAQVLETVPLTKERRT